MLYGVRKWSSFILLQVVDQISQHHLLKKKESWPFLFFLMSSTPPSAAIPPGSGPSGPGVWAARLRGQRGATLSRVDTQAAPMLLSDSRFVRQVLKRGEGPDALWLGFLCLRRKGIWT